jgi:hypothetical protein
MKPLRRLLKTGFSTLALLSATLATEAVFPKAAPKR